MASQIQQVAANITAIGSATPWLKHNYFERPFNVSLGVYFGTGLSATLEVQYILDDQSQTGQRAVQLTQSANTITVTDTGPQNINGAGPNWGGPWGHGLAVGDQVWLQGTQAGVDGQYSVATVTSANVYTLTSTVSQTLALTQAQVSSGRVLPHATLVGVTARQSGNYGAPCWASRLYCTAYTASGVAYLVAMQGGALS